MAKFETGKTYGWCAGEYDPIKILRRTQKSVVVTNGSSTWRMIIKIDADGNEFVVDSSVPKRWQSSFTCSAQWELP